MARNSRNFKGQGPSLITDAPALPSGWRAGGSLLRLIAGSAVPGKAPGTVRGHGHRSQEPKFTIPAEPPTTWAPVEIASLNQLPHL